MHNGAGEDPRSPTRDGQVAQEAGRLAADKAYSSQAVTSHDRLDNS
ncbi:hypothetical protein SSAG_00553 [Streptomyces sp. Mg1]|nr:hypothetical protein SSAG_00553 [Streptomyces sp. Mg1]